MYLIKCLWLQCNFILSIISIMCLWLPYMVLGSRSSSGCSFSTQLGIYSVWQLVVCFFPMLPVAQYVSCRVCMLSHLSHAQLFVTPWTKACQAPLPMEWIAVPSSRGSSQFRDQIYISHVSCVGRRVLYHQHHPWSPYILHIYLHITKFF